MSHGAPGDDVVPPGSRGAPQADRATVVALLGEQHPDLVELPLRRGPSGWDNHHWLLGDDLAVRLPRRRLAVPLVANEARWLPELAARLPVPVPVPVRTGTPGAGWPWPWTVVRWRRGQRLDELPRRRTGTAAAAAAGSGAPSVPHGPGPPPAVVDDLAAVLRALHVPAPPTAPRNPYRGVPLATRGDDTGRRLAEVARHRADGRLPGEVPDDAEEVLQAAVAVGVAAGDDPRPARWCHGDLHPGNLLVAGGRLAAVVDWGDVCAADPAVDLAVRWWAVPRHQHGALVAALPGVDAATWARAAGWAATIAAFLLAQAPRAGDHRLLATAVATVRRLRGV